jgi:adenylate kinase
MKDLILIGPQGSGKGTQAKILAEKFGFKIFETGGELRKIAADENSELGKKIKEITTRGDLVPNEIVMEIVSEFIENIDGNSPVIFDGIPRSEVQRISLEKLISEKKREFTALEIYLSEAETFSRLEKRAKIEGRADDNLNAIKKRLENFHTHTAPLLNVWHKNGKLVSVDGKQDVEKVLADIIEKLNL